MNKNLLFKCPTCKDKVFTAREKLSAKPKEPIACKNCGELAVPRRTISAIIHGILVWPLGLLAIFLIIQGIWGFLIFIVVGCILIFGIELAIPLKRVNVHEEQPTTL